MMAWMTLCGMAALIALGVRVADRWAFLKNRPVRTGVWFGLLAAFANTFSADVGGMGISVRLIDAPPMVAGFFFGPVAGVVSGSIAAFERTLTPLWGVGVATWGRCSLSTLLVALYAAALGKWVFDGKRPPVLAAVVTAAFGEVLHLSLNGLFGLGHLAETIEIIVAAVTPMTVGSGLTAGLSAIACDGGQNFRKNLFATPAPLFLLFGLAFGLVIVGSAVAAGRYSASALEQAIQDIETRLDDQIGYMLHRDAAALASQIRAPRPESRQQVGKWAEIYDVDEINVVGTNGIIVASNEPAVDVGKTDFFGNPTVKAPYRELMTGDRLFVKQRFRPSVEDPDNLYKYIAVRLPEGGLLQMGYSWKHLMTEFREFFFPMFVDTNVGKTGFYVIAGRRGRIVERVAGHPEANGKTLRDIGFTPGNLSVSAGTLFPARVFGVWSRCVFYDRIGGWRIYAVLPFAETQGPALFLCLATGFILFLMCVLFRLVMIRFRRAQDRIDALRAEEEKRRADDMRLAHQIQKSELRTSFPETDAYRLFASMKPAREVGGDFYDFYTLDDGRFVVTIADVSGKGVPAAFFMMKAKEKLKNCLHREPSLVAALAAANRTLVRNNEAEMFVTVWIGLYDPATGMLEYASAGHNPPLLHHADGSVEWLKVRPSPPMAAVDGVTYRSQMAQLQAGDSLFLYTDGVTEAQNAQHELYGDDRLEAAVRRAEDAFVTEIGADVDRFVAGADQADDITMMTLDIKAVKGI